MVTAEEVKQAALKAGLTYVPWTECSICGVEIGYHIQGENLFYSPSCGCTSYGASMEPRSWEDAAASINMQSNKEWYIKLAAKFGLVVT